LILEYASVSKQQDPQFQWVSFLYRGSASAGNRQMQRRGAG